MKLGHRLSQLEGMLKQRYSIIWDCCCDHGFLGMSLLQNKLADKVVFVDVLVPQMAQLERKLKQRFPADKFDWEVLCQDLQEVTVPEADSQLFIIAGVGADSTIRFVDSLCASRPGAKFDLLVCSVHGSYSVREALSRHGFRLKDERIILENNRFYEGIYVSQTADTNIMNTGAAMWDWLNPEHREYAHRLSGHYSKKAKTDPTKFQSISVDYKRLFNAINPDIVHQSGSSKHD